MANSNDNAAAGCGCLVLIAIVFGIAKGCGGGDKDKETTAAAGKESMPGLEERSAPTGVAPARIPLQLAASRGLVDVRVKANDGKSLKLEIKPNTQDILRVVVAPGTVFSKGGAADLKNAVIALRSSEIFTDPYTEWDAAEVAVAPLSADCPVLRPGEKFAIDSGQLTDDLWKLLSLRKNEELDEAELHFAIWVAQYDIGIEDRAIRHASGITTASWVNAHLPGIRNILTSAGIDIQAKKIFQPEPKAPGSTPGANPSRRPSRPPTIPPLEPRDPKPVDPEPAPPEPPVPPGAMTLPGVTSSRLHAKLDLKSKGFKTTKDRPGGGNVLWTSNLESGAGISYDMAVKADAEDKISEIFCQVADPNASALDERSATFFGTVSNYAAPDVSSTELSEWIKANVGNSVSHSFGDVTLTLEQDTSQRKLTIAPTP